jgi:hypothetical protein
MQTGRHPKEETMSVSKRKNRRLLILFAVAVGVGAIGIPAAQAAKLSPLASSYLVQNRDALNAYAHRWITQAPASSVPFITENSASQNRIGQSRPNYGPYDPWAYRFVHQSNTSVPFVTEHAPSQNQIDRLNSTPVSTSSPNTFDWGDAGVGAGSAMALMLLTAAGALGIRRNQSRRVAL